MSARRHAQLQMLAMQEIERQHGRAPLAVLAELAVEGVLASPSTRDETAP